MKYTILINQAGVVHEGLEMKTDVIDWALLDYIFSWQQNPKADRFEGMTWLDYKHLIKEMPLLGLNKKQSVSDRIKKSKNLGLIDTIQHPTNKRIFVKTTSVYYRVCQFKGVRDDGQGVRDDGQGVRENRHEEFVKTDIDTTINNSTINDSLKESAPKKAKNSGGGNEAKKEMGFKKPTVEEVESYIIENGFSVDAGRFFDYYESNGWVVSKAPMKNWQATVRNWHRREQQGGSNATRQQYNKPARLSANERIEKACNEKFGQQGASILEGECRRTA